jgi:tetratricopeptide (TPR) repeat protein
MIKKHLSTSEDDGSITQLIQQCSDMEEQELLNSVTIERHQFRDGYLEIALMEIEKRGYDIKSVKVAFNEENEKTLTIEEAFLEFKDTISPLDAVTFTNSLDEMLVIQREFHNWGVHYFYHQEYQKSFFIKTANNAKEALKGFLYFKNWTDAVEGEEHHIDSWKLWASSDSFSYIEDLSRKIHDMDIFYTVNTTNLSLFNAIFGAYYDRSLLYILVAPDHFDRANEVTMKMQERIDELFDQLDKLEQEPDEIKELEIYTELTRLSPNDALAFFNKGVLLYEMERDKEAAEAFMEAASLTMRGADPEQAEDSEEILDEIENVLIELSEKTPDDTSILHTVASIFSYQGNIDWSIEYFEKILSLDPKDDVAHINLGYLYNELPNEQTKALTHFKEYLALNPDDEDRASIESMIAELELT